VIIPAKLQMKKYTYYARIENSPYWLGGCFL